MLKGFDKAMEGFKPLFLMLSSTLSTWLLGSVNNKANSFVVAVSEIIGLCCACNNCT